MPSPLLALIVSAVIFYFRRPQKNDSQVQYIFARSCEIPQIAAPCELSALLVMHEVYKGRVHSQKGPQPLHGVLSLEKDDERVEKGVSIP